MAAVALREGDAQSFQASKKGGFVDAQSLGGGLAVVVVFFQGGLDRLGLDQAVKGLGIGRDRRWNATGR